MNTFNPKRTSLGYSQTRSSVLRASRFNKSDENNHAKCLAPPPPPKNAKVAAPMRRGAGCENISTLDTLLGYMENYPKVSSSAFGTIGKPGKKDATGASAATSLPAPKPVKPAGLLGTKSSADMPGLSLPGYQASSCIVMSQKGVDKPQYKVDQEQQTAKAEQQQKLLDGSIAGDVKSGRDTMEPGTKRTAVIGKRSGNEVQEPNPAVETDKAKPTSGQKRPLAFYDIRIPKKARGEVSKTLPAVATATNTRKAPDGVKDDEVRTQRHV
ncbi:hypothetical protein GGI22_005985 [Coemansia erecta]|nr:hypothetical protein GGI22_005985 [Coemansia erecta]